MACSVFYRHCEAIFHRKQFLNALGRPRLCQGSPWNNFPKYNCTSSPLLYSPLPSFLIIQVEKERDLLRQTIAGLEADLEGTGKEVEGERKKLEELTRERDILTKLRSQVPDV
jgi:hypothetical protein